MKYQRFGLSIPVALALASTVVLVPKAHAIDVTAGDWTLSFEGNVNAHFIYSRCDTAPNAIVGGLACISTDSSSSGVSNGLLPAALKVSGATTQSGYDIAFTFGLYPGISTNDGGSPNLHNTAGPTNTALGTAGLDIRQVFLTFGNSTMGTVMAGRNIGLFGGDAILNDMTIIGVGGGNGNYAAPFNTSLGSIGLGYIYTDWLAQINYTTPDFSGAKLTLGVFQPLNTLEQPLPSSKKNPGAHAKIAWKLNDFLYFSASYLYQQQRNTTVSLVTPGDYTSHAFDVGGKVDFAGFEVAGWYYNGRGVGTTGLFVLGDDGDGHARKSDGFLAQITYKILATKFGFSYGQSKLNATGFEISPALVAKNDRYTFGIYQDLTKNLTLVAEASRINSDNQIDQKNHSLNFNIGAFLKF